MLDDILDFITDTFSYIFGFEWIGDIWEFFGSMFENLSDFSILGAVFGIIGFFTIYLARDYMLNPFLVHMGPFEAGFWG